MVAAVISTFGMALVHLFIGLIGSVVSVFLGMRLINKMTGHVDEWSELKKGNAAIGILFVSVIIAILIMIAPTAILSINLIQSFKPAGTFFVNVVIVFINILLSALFSIFTLYLGFQIADRLTFDINELSELKKGNVAVALMISAILLGLAFVTTASITEIVSVINLVGFVK